VLFAYIYDRQQLLATNQVKSLPKTHTANHILITQCSIHVDITYSNCTMTSCWYAYIAHNHFLHWPKSSGEIWDFWRLLQSKKLVLIYNAVTQKRSWVQILLGAKLRNNLGQVVHTNVPVTKKYNLVLTKGQWCSLAGKVTAGLAESNGSLLPGGQLMSPAGWLPVHQDQLRAQRSVMSMGSLYLLCRRDKASITCVCRHTQAFSDPVKTGLAPDCWASQLIILSVLLTLTHCGY